MVFIKSENSRDGHWSVSLMNLGTTPEMDREGHAIALGVSIVGLLATQGFKWCHKRDMFIVVYRWILDVVNDWTHTGYPFGYGVVSSKYLVVPATRFSSIGFLIRLAHPFLLIWPCSPGWQPNRCPHVINGFG